MSEIDKVISNDFQAVHSIAGRQKRNKENVYTLEDIFLVFSYLSENKEIIQKIIEIKDVDIILEELYKLISGELQRDH